MERMATARNGRHRAYAMIPFRMRCVAKILAILALGCLAVIVDGAAPAQATSCTSSQSNVAFGTINTSDNTNNDLTSTFVFTCTGAAPNQSMRACMAPSRTTDGGDGSSGPYYIEDSASDILRYNVYIDSAHSQPFTTGTYQPYTYTADSTGKSTYTAYVYYRIPSGQTTVPAGNYSANIIWKLVASDTSALGSNCTGTAGGLAGPNLQVTASNQATCTVTGASLNFGSVSTLTSNVDGSAVITATCVNGTAYTLGLDGGQNGGTNAANRSLVNGSGAITYGLYSDAARSQGWFGDSVSSTGVGASQNFTVYGRVPPQTTPAPGTYSDTVVITLTY